MEDDSPIGHASWSWFQTLSTDEQDAVRAKKIIEAIDYAERTLACADSLEAQDVTLDEELTFLFDHTGLPHPDRLSFWVLSAIGV